MQADARPSPVSITTPHRQSTVNLSPPPAPLRDAALGVVATQSFPAVIGTADAMVKAADVVLVGYEKIGDGHCTVIVRGRVADVRMAVATGVETAKQFGEFVSSTLIPRPLPNLDAVLPISVQLADLEPVADGQLSQQAVGLLETRGFPAMVGAADAMVKSADVTLVSHETIGAGLCTIIIRGSLPNVALAIEAGMHEAERIGELNAVMVIPRPLAGLERVLPKVKAQVLETPVKIPLKIEEKAREVVLLEETAAESLADAIALETVDLPRERSQPLPDLSQPLPPEEL